MEAMGDDATTTTTTTTTTATQQYRQSPTETYLIITTKVQTDDAVTTPSISSLGAIGPVLCWLSFRNNKEQKCSVVCENKIQVHGHKQLR